jgi:hypothetical protein
MGPGAASTTVRPADLSTDRIPVLPHGHPKQEELERREAAYIVLTEGRRILKDVPQPVGVDLGGGDGSSLAQLGATTTFHEMISVDLRLPATGGYPGISYRVCRAEEVRSVVALHSADLVLMVEVIEHLIDPDEAMDSIKAILSRRGAILITTPNLSSLLNRFALLLGFLPLSAEVSTRKVFGRPGSVVAGHLRLHTSRSLRGFLTYHGLIVDRLYSVANSRSMYSQLGSLGRLIEYLDRFAARLPGALGSRLVVVARVREP